MVQSGNGSLKEDKMKQNAREAGWAGSFVLDFLQVQYHYEC